MITSAQVTDSGRYTCLAENEAGEARVTYDLQVHGMYHSQMYITFVVALDYNRIVRGGYTGCEWLLAG